jgi:glutamyl-tRNA synthetase
LPDETVSWDDIVIGSVSYDLRNISDPVIMKPDGSFLYTFTSVIDDVDCGVTHVIRGQDHVTNTSAQIAIFRTISAGHPRFAHISLIVNKDGSQFSKRLGGMSLGDIRMDGIDPMAVLNMLATLGTSLDPVPFTDLNDLANYFDITKFSANSPKFDMDNILLLNKKIIQSRTYDDIRKRLGRDLMISPELFEIVRENVDGYGDIARWEAILSPNFVASPPHSEAERNVLNAAARALQRVRLEDLVRTVGEETGSSGGGLYVPLRKALTGLEHGPDLRRLLLAMGKQEVERRIRWCLA